MSQFFAMGGYALYVWPAYGLSFLAIGALTVLSFARRRAARRDVEMLESRAP